MERHSDQLEQSGSKVRQVNKQERRPYDANSKIMVINQAESSNNCRAAKKYGVTECDVKRWQAQRKRLQNVNSLYKNQMIFKKAFCVLKKRSHLIIRVVLYSGQYGNSITTQEVFLVGLHGE